MLRKCEQCNEFVYGEHHCELFEFEVEDYDVIKQYGVDIEDALKKFAERYNDEGDLINKEIVAIYNGKEYVLSAEISITYSVKEK